MPSQNWIYEMKIKLKASFWGLYQNSGHKLTKYGGDFVITVYNNLTSTVS